MELVAPAGNPEKLAFAWNYGADAAYIGIKNFSLRSQADNFYEHEYLEIVKIKKNKKLYGAFNIFFHDHDIRRLEEEIEYISRYAFDALIVSDLGIVPLLRRNFPQTPLHLSTQANCLNAESAKYYRDLGFSRIIAAREASLGEIEQIKKKAGLETEIFVHGAMCLAYSGRCFLSAYMADRSANSGNCSHSCRWQYRVLEESERPGEYFPVEENGNFTTVMSSHDLCMIDYIKEIENAGVDAVKIEGRMKSAYYTAVTVRAYRAALDRSADFPFWKLELDNVSHRPFSTGFYFGREQIQKPAEQSYIQNYVFIGTVTGQAEKNLYNVKLKNRFASGDTVEFLFFGGLMQPADFEILDENKNPADVLHPGKICFIRINAPLPENTIIRKKNNNSQNPAFNS
ncbi:MAG: peptidase U32 [Spirochaetes bacterium GWF1_41_5]|nr:MAG: peptidase U32 [Spirochaetes bacterium GWF1_41_5]HBE04474.1 peptidase U32 [Spirochaetia bacterium]